MGQGWKSEVKVVSKVFTRSDVVKGKVNETVSDGLKCLVRVNGSIRKPLIN